MSEHFTFRPEELQAKVVERAKTIVLRAKALLLLESRADHAPLKCLDLCNQRLSWENGLEREPEQKGRLGNLQEGGLEWSIAYCSPVHCVRV